MERGKTLEVRIREAKPEDYPKIKEVSKRAFARESIHNVEQDIELQIGEYFKNIDKYDIWDTEEILEKKVFLSQKVYVAEDGDGEIIGCTGVERHNIDGYDAEGAFWLNWTAVEPEYQGCCVGKKMILQVMKYVKSIGGLALNIKTNPSFESACKTYEKLGFKVIGRLPNYYGKDCDSLIYSLDLTSINWKSYKKLLG